MSLFEEIFSKPRAHLRRAGNEHHYSSLSGEALQRYRYMLQTAPPEAIEQAHTDAFAQLTPEQRRHILHELARAAPGDERAFPGSAPDDPRALARLATRVELQHPGLLERVLGGRALGAGGGVLVGIAVSFVGSMVAQSLFSSLNEFGDDSGAALAADGEPEPSDELGFGDEGTSDFSSDDFGVAM